MKNELEELFKEIKQGNNQSLKDLYDKYKEQEELFIKAGGNVAFKYISITEYDKHFDEVRKMARNE